MDKLNQENALHLSDEVYTLMGEAWKAGVDGDSDLLSMKISDVEAQMKKELKAEMEKRASLPGSANASATQ